MKTGKTYRRIGQVGGERNRENELEERERSSVGGEGKMVWVDLTIGRVNT
jgi:hypothetical protein